MTTIAKHFFQHGGYWSGRFPVKAIMMMMTTNNNNPPEPKRKRKDPPLILSIVTVHQMYTISESSCEPRSGPTAGNPIRFSSAKFYDTATKPQ
jgi:hypothetical protein